MAEWYKGRKYSEKSAGVKEVGREGCKVRCSLLMRAYFGLYFVGNKELLKVFERQSLNLTVVFSVQVLISIGSKSWLWVSRIWPQRLTKLWTGDLGTRKQYLLPTQDFSALQKSPLEFSSDLGLFFGSILEQYLLVIPFLQTAIFFLYISICVSLEIPKLPWRELGGVGYPPTHC